MVSKGTLGSWGVSSALGSFHPDLRTHPCEPLSWYACPSGVWFPSTIQGYPQLCYSPPNPFSSGTCDRGWIKWVKSSSSNQTIIYSLYITCKWKSKSTEGLHTHIFSFLTLYIHKLFLGFGEANRPAAFSLFWSLPPCQFSPAAPDDLCKVKPGFLLHFLIPALFLENYLFSIWLDLSWDTQQFFSILLQHPLIIVNFCHY